MQQVLNDALTEKAKAESAVGSAEDDVKAAKKQVDQTKKSLKKVILYSLFPFCFFVFL